MKSPVTFVAVIGVSLSLAMGSMSAHAGEPSLHDFDVTFVDQDGRKVTLADLEGQPVLITMFYGQCAYACPLLVARMRRLEAKSPATQQQKLRMVLVTFDPERDTVSALKKLHTAHGLDPSRWSFLRVADPDAVQELAAILGVKYRFMPDGSINHSSVITLLDGGGVVRARMDGMDLPDETLLDALHRL